MRIAFGLALLLASPLASASVYYPPPTTHTVDPSLAATDSVAPSVPVIASLSVAQHHGNPGGTRCAPQSALTLTLSKVTDNSSPATKLGYEITLVAGTLPKNLTLPVGAVRPGDNDMVDPPSFVLPFGESNADLDFTLAVTAVDEAGNRSAVSTPVQVIDHATGCSASGRPVAHLPSLLLVLSALWIARRSRVLHLSKN